MKSMQSMPMPAGPGSEIIARTESGLWDRLSGLLALIRPLFFILTPVNAAGAAVLALGGFPSPGKCVLGFIAVAFASCAVNVFNDYTDRERDKVLWPARPIPAGRISPREALVVVIVSLGISLSIAWLAFNPLTFSILLLAIVLGVLYSVYLRDKVGYLSLPPIVGLIYLGGWAALAPDTIFGSWLPWYLYLLGVVWQTAHIMVYYPLHVAPATGETRVKTPKAFFFRPSTRAAVNIGLVFTGLTMLFSLSLFLMTSLGVLYLCLVLVAGAGALWCVVTLAKDVRDRDRGLRAFTSVSVFRLVISAAILLSIGVSQAGWL
jgi:4-hydroxybenzoate polyprenyltransferase